LKQTNKDIALELKNEIEKSKKSKLVLINQIEKLNSDILSLKETDKEKPQKSLESVETKKQQNLERQGFEEKVQILTEQLNILQTNEQTIHNKYQQDHKILKDKINQQKKRLKYTELKLKILKLKLVLLKELMKPKEKKQKKIIE